MTFEGFVRHGRVRAPQDPAARAPSRFQRPHGPVRRLGHAGRVLRHQPSTWPFARAPGCSTSATWARSRSPARTRWPQCSGSRATTPAGCRRARRSTRRCSRPTAPSWTTCSSIAWRRATSCWSSTPRTSARTTPGSASRSRAVGDAAAIDSSSRYALIALQGPAAREVLQPLTGVDLGDIGYYWFAHGEVATARATISRTGYTGEDGFEIFVPPNMADRVWQALLESGRSADVIPCGLGARDTLRLEAGDAPVRQRHRRDDDGARGRARVDRRLEEGRLHRPRSLLEQKERGPSRKLVGFEMIDRGDRAPWLSGGERRPAGRRRHERNADAVSEEGDRDGLRARRSCTPGHGDRRSTSAAVSRRRASCRCRSIHES